MAPSEVPPDEKDELSKEPTGQNVSQDGSAIEFNGEIFNPADQFSIDQDPQVKDIQLDQIEGLDNNDLRADTLEFESISRRPKRRTAGIKTVLFFLVIGVGGYFAWTLWGDAILRVDDLPIVRAPEKPFKMRPEEPGGKNFPNRDKLVYDRLDRKPPRIIAENLLPRPEVPLIPPQSKKIETDELTVKSEKRNLPLGTIGSQATTKEVKAIKKPFLNSAPLGLRKIERKTSIKPSSKIQSKSLPNLAPAIIRNQAIKNQRIKSYQIQLAAVRTIASAEKEWLRLRTKNKALLGKLKLNIIRADLGNQGIFFRLRAGPVANQTSAKALCQSLYRKKVGCLVIAPPK
jgi:cell division septation protein DedD